MILLSLALHSALTDKELLAETTSKWMRKWIFGISIIFYSLIYLYHCMILKSLAKFLLRLLLLQHHKFK